MKCGKRLDGQACRCLTYLFKSSPWLPALELEGKEARLDVVSEEVIALVKERRNGAWTRELAMEMGHLK